MLEPSLSKIDIDGFVVLPGVYNFLEVEAILSALEASFQMPEGTSAIRAQSGNVYAARNVIGLWREAATIWCKQPLADALNSILGPEFGLVRVMYFDKPPEHTWALPWHKDLTIAVRDNRIPSREFSKPTTKGGVPHVEAPLIVLEQMLTARIHLDDVTLENGPLRVIPGSHGTGKVLCLRDEPMQDILVRKGDVLLMRPLLAHSSNRSQPETQRHRRILHLEFASSPELPEGYTWFDYRTADSPRN